EATPSQLLHCHPPLATMDASSSASLPGWNPDYDPMMNKPSIKRQYVTNSKILLAAIISSLIVVVLIVILHLYTRCALRRKARHRITLQQQALSTEEQVHIDREPPKTGLDPIVIASIPVFLFRHSDDDDDNVMTIECAVCLSILEDDEMAKILLNCKHIFHVGCIDTWLSSQSTCPICRAEAKPLPLPFPKTPVASVPPTAPPLQGVNSPLRSTEGTLVDEI
ncbi:RING-type E3 ubiquitin transferase, partial [Sarracenia purpurea var. burkii]